MDMHQRQVDATTILADEPPSRRERARTSLLDRLSRPSPTIWLSGQEAAEYVGVSWPTLRQAIIEFGIPHVRLGTCWRIEVAVLDEHLRRMARA